MLAVLMLRGPQTLGRAQAAHRAAALLRVARRRRRGRSTRLAERELAERQPRRPGERDDRYLHLLGRREEAAPAEPQPPGESLEQRVARLEDLVADLQRRLPERLSASLRRLLVVAAEEAPGQAVAVLPARATRGASCPSPAATIASATIIMSADVCRDRERAHRVIVPRLVSHRATSAAQSSSTRCWIAATISFAPGAGGARSASAAQPLLDRKLVLRLVGEPAVAVDDLEERPEAASRPRRAARSSDSRGSCPQPTRAVGEDVQERRPVGLRGALGLHGSGPASATGSAPARRRGCGARRRSPSCPCAAAPCRGSRARRGSSSCSRRTASRRSAGRRCSCTPGCRSRRRRSGGRARARPRAPGGRCRRCRRRRRTRRT